MDAIESYYPDDRYKADLNQARLADRKTMPGETATKKREAKVQVVSLLTDWPYFFAGMFALLKDLLDLVGLGSLPVIGTVITVLVSGGIAFFIFLTGASERNQKTAKKLAGRWKKKMLQKIVILVAGTIIEGFLFGLNFLPIETLTVIFIYSLTIRERRKMNAEI